jgi:phenylpropionate dioxygenase-like ring-hydroxylating dioxygenase large terminal subunit
MFENLWYAVEFSTAITDRPQLVTIFDRQITIYRDDRNKLQALSNICPHRGASLADGNIRDNCIVCPYHGWHFKGDGSCVKIPANASGVVIPRQAVVKTYPVQEKDGWVWLFLGDRSKAQDILLPELPQIQNDQMRMLQGDFCWQVNYERAMDNGLDFAHAPFVHAGAFGNPEQPEVAPLQIELQKMGASATVLLAPNPPKGLWKFLAKKEPALVKTRTGFVMPNLTFLEVNLPFGTLVIWTAHVPRDNLTTISKWMNFRSFFTGKWADSDARKRTLKIFEQDQPIVAAQYPQKLPLESDAEIFVAADLLQLKYRELRRKFQ